VVADQVSQVLDLPPQEIGAPPPFGPRIRVDYILGMGKVGKRFVHILDIDGVLSASELLAVSAAGVGEAPAEGGPVLAAAGGAT
jgi:purine-binding chemotaxis protein CheW